MNIETFLEEIKKETEFIGVIDTLDKIKKVDVIPFGIRSLDTITGIGGVPRGMISELYGAESTTKTSLSLLLVANAQKAGIKCAFVDLENALTNDLAIRFGVNPSDLVVARPIHGEEAFEFIEEMTNKGYGLIIVDSVSALTPEDELEDDFDQSTIGLQASLMSKAMRKIIGLMMRTNTAVVFLNQIRDEIGKFGYGEKTTTSGGRALKFYSALRIKLARIGWLKKGDENAGMTIRAVTAKNKLDRPQRTTDIEYYWETGFAIEEDKLNAVVTAGGLEIVGRTYFHKKEKIGGKEEAIKYINEHNL